jgi:hypothetical protein
MNVIPSILWSLLALDKIDDKSLKLIHKSTTLIEKEGVNKFSFADCVLTN